MRISFFVLAFTGSFALAVAQKNLPRNLNVQNWADDFVFDQESFYGDWSSDRNWKGTFCNGVARYRGQVSGRTDGLRFGIEEGYIEVIADFKDIWGKLDGTYRSGYSACNNLSGELALSSDWAHIRMHVFLNPANEPKPVNRIEVKETRLGRMHFGRWVPWYLEDYATILINTALEKVWAGQMGDWINRKITDKVKNFKRKLAPISLE